MRAVWLTHFVRPEEIVVAQLSGPEVRDGEALVRVHAAGVNPSDVKYAGGVVPTTPLPRVPGRDFAGVVEQGPAHLIGVSVYGTGGDLGIRRNGSHADLLALPASGVAGMPGNLTMAQAASVGVPYVTAYKALVELASLQPGETVLIIGGSGSVGRAAAQIAKWLRCRVIATTRSGERADSWRQYVDIVLTVPEDDIADGAMSATQGRGAQVVFNVVGGETFEGGVNALAADGRMVCIAATGSHRVFFDLMTFYKRQMRWFGLDTLEMSASECAPILDQLRPEFQAGTFAVEVGREFPIEQASMAYAMVGNGGSGKVVLTMT